MKYFLAQAFACAFLFEKFLVGNNCIMKRVLVLFALLFFVVAIGVFSKTTSSLYASSKDISADRYYVYVSSLTEVCLITEECSVLDLGFCYEVSCKSPISTKETEKTLGRTTTFLCKKSEINRILAENGICVTQKNNIGECLVFEGYIKNGFENQKAQVAYNDGTLSIGIPVIFGAY